LLLLGLETLSLRMQKHVENAKVVAEYLSRHPKVSWVEYPSLPGSKYYPMAQKYTPKGAGSIFAFGVKGSREDIAKFMDSLELFVNLTHVGATQSIVTHSATTTHAQLSDEDLVKAGVSPDMIRISVGTEDVKDLIDDLEQALAKI